MPKKIILVLFSFAFLFYFNLAQAEVFINEVQISGVSADDEFIELYNSGSSIVDLTDWYINKKSSTGNETTLVAKSRLENKSIPANSYFLLARENGYVGTVTPDVFWPNSYSLASNNSILLYKGNETDKDQIDWENIEEGKSLQRQSNNSWKAGTPTPGKANETKIDPPPPPASGGGSTISTTESKQKVTEIPKIKTKIIAKALAFTGNPVEFSASTTGHSNEPLLYGKYFWNFGDGDAKETKASETAKFAHTFFYEGEYQVILEYYQNFYGEIPDATDEILIKVVPADISISSVGEEADFFVEISNNTSYDTDLSKWVLVSSAKNFTFPKNTILGSKKKIILSPRITGFSILDKDTLKLLNPQGETVFDYKASIEPVPTLVKNPTPVKISKLNLEENSQAVSQAVKPPSGGFTAKLDKQVPVDNQVALALQSEPNTPKSKNNLMYEIGLFVFLGVSAGGAYFVRQHNRKPISGETTESDFEIIDE